MGQDAKFRDDPGFPGNLCQMVTTVKARRWKSARPVKTNNLLLIYCFVKLSILCHKYYVGKTTYASLRTYKFMVSIYVGQIHFVMVELYLSVLLSLLRFIFITIDFIEQDGIVY